MIQYLQKVAWKSVPQFGGWDQNTGEAHNYSVIFSEARANKKKQKADITTSLGNDQEFKFTPHRQYYYTHQHHQQDESIIVRRPHFYVFKTCI